MSSSCFGVDINRNFGHHFQATSDVSFYLVKIEAKVFEESCSQPCGENFSGPYAFSEEETKAMEKLLTAYEGKVKMYLSVQANGPQILIPYNYIAVGSSSQSQLMSLAGQAATVMENVNGRAYRVGVAGTVHGLESGTSLDYAYESRRIQLSFILRLPSTGNSIAGNQLPSYLTEAFKGFLVFARHAASTA